MDVYKNSGIRTEKFWKRNLLLGSVLLMISSLLIGRGVLSAATILFLLLAIAGSNGKALWQQFVHTPFLYFSTLLFFIPFVSGLWSNNVEQWLDVVRLKLPLLFFPLAAAGTWQFLPKQWLAVAAVFLAVVLAGCCWSLLHYVGHMQEVHEGYLKAKTLQTPLENDHVRFSWLVSVAAMTSVLLLQVVKQKPVTWLLWLLAGFFALYLHVLSARTGMIALYIFLLLYAGWLLREKKNRGKALLCLFIFVSLPVLAYFTVPTFQNRIRYLVYDHSFVQKNQYLPGANDGARVMSLKAGWQVLQQNPWGVGAGDVMQEADKWYATHVPQVLSSDKFYPSSEWLLYAAFAGWPGLVLFSFVMVLSLLARPGRYRVFWVALQATAALSFVYDMGLIVQYGIFLYAFITCWWWKWLGASGQQWENQNKGAWSVAPGAASVANADGSRRNADHK